MHPGTKGVTDGEPGTGAHCCGMKGLGGATVELLCIPKQVARGEPFTVNVHYTTDVKRPVDVHVRTYCSVLEYVFGSLIVYNIRIGRL